MPDAILTCITAAPDGTSSRSSLPPAQVQNATIYDDEEKTAIPARPNFMFQTSAMLKKFMPRKDFGRDGRFGPNRLVSHILSDLRLVVFNSYANLLFVFVPAGFALNYAKQNPIAIFAVNMVAVTGPSSLIQLATQQVEQRSSELIGSMVNASFRYAQEILLCNLFGMAETEKQHCATYHIHSTAEESSDSSLANIAHWWNSLKHASYAWAWIPHRRLALQGRKLQLNYLPDPRYVDAFSNDQPGNSHGLKTACQHHCFGHPQPVPGHKCHTAGCLHFLLFLSIQHPQHVVHV